MLAAGSAMAQRGAPSVGRVGLGTDRAGNSARDRRDKSPTEFPSGGRECHCSGIRDAPPGLLSQGSLIPIVSGDRAEIYDAILLVAEGHSVRTLSVFNNID